MLPGPEDSESRRARFRRLSVLPLAAAAGPVSSSSRARTSAGRRRVKGASAGWCWRERSGRHGSARLDAAKACATVAVLGRRADGDGDRWWWHAEAVERPARRARYLRREAAQVECGVGGM